MSHTDMMNHANGWMSGGDVGLAAGRRSGGGPAGRRCYQADQKMMHSKKNLGWPCKRVWRAALWVVLMFANYPAIALAQSSCPGIHVEVPNIRNSAGSLSCALFETPEGFPSDFMRFAVKLVMTKVQNGEASCDFAGIPPGTYAIVVIHDENLNGELDKNFLGIPNEGYGFSNEAKAGFSAPSFSGARFMYDGGRLDLTVELKY